MFFKFGSHPVYKVCESVTSSIANILERFSDDTNKQNSIVKIVKKNFLKINNFKKR